MTDRLKGVWVAFDRDIREDDAEGLINAIRCLRHVVGVKRSVASSDDWINRQRIRSELRERLWDALADKEGGD